MPRQHALKVAIFLGIFFPGTGGALAQTKKAPTPPPSPSKPFFVEINFDFGFNVAQRGLPGLISDCLNNQVCSGTIKVVAKYIGVPPVVVDIGKEGFNAAPKAGSTATLPDSIRVEAEYRGAQEAYFNFNYPPGYVYCATSVKSISLSPRTGHNAGHIEAAKGENLLNLHVWTHQERVKGGSHVNAKVTMYGVLAEKASKARAGGFCATPGTFTPEGKVLLMNCRGWPPASQGERGMPPCNEASDLSRPLQEFKG